MYALKHDIKAPKNLFAILEDFLRERHLLYETEEGEFRRELTAGVAQRSVLGPEM